MYIYNIEIGKMYKGTVTSLSSYGAFVDIDGIVQGLLHISGISLFDFPAPKAIFIGILFL